VDDLWIQAKEWFLGLGDKYGVDPIIFGVIYVGAIPFFTLSVAWLIHNYRKGKSIVLPTLSTGFFFISAYLYLFIVGENIPIWVYAMLIILIAYGAYSSIKSIKAKATAPTPSKAPPS